MTQLADSILLKMLKYFEVMLFLNSCTLRNFRTFIILWKYIFMNYLLVFLNPAIKQDKCQLFFLLSRTIVKKKIKFSSKKIIAIIIINPMYSSKNQTILSTLLCQKIV